MLLKSLNCVVRCDYFKEWTVQVQLAVWCPRPQPSVGRQLAVAWPLTCPGRETPLWSRPFRWLPGAPPSHLYVYLAPPPGRGETCLPVRESDGPTLTPSLLPACHKLGQAGWGVLASPPLHTSTTTGPWVVKEDWEQLISRRRYSTSTDSSDHLFDQVHLWRIECFVSKW